MNQSHDPNVTADIPLAADCPMRSIIDSGVDSSPTRTAGPPSVRDRYTLDDEIARGGMGIIYRATDWVLGREVAVKVLHEKYAPDSGAALRFAGEARITGQLQHPSIPPVHDLGTLADGRPFLAMKLIKGQTLEELLKARPDPSSERSRFVAVFEQICHALAYAHAHNVIHRDLKPANVMVGAFGEVQMMDWGLAKVLASRGCESPDSAPEVANEATRAWTQMHPTPDLGSHTQAGSMLGTPAFAPPEQVAGELDKVDARSDVFGLGAILAMLLTGKPPYVGETFESLRVQALRGKLDDCLARLAACAAESELVALCKRCLAFEPVDRPANAGVVARAVASLRAAADERARRAELERVRVEGDNATAVVREAEQRKRRRVQLALAAAVVGLLLGAGAFAWLRNDQAQIVRQREGRNAEAVTAHLGQCEDALRADDEAKATVALDAARKRSAEGGAEEQSERLAADVALLRELDAADQSGWTLEEGKLPDVAVVATRTREALKRFGADPDAVSPDDAAARVSASMVRERIVTALDRLLMPIRLVDVDKLSAEEQKPYTPQLRADVAALLAKTTGVRAVLRLVDADPYRDAVLFEDRAKFVELAGQKAALEQPPGFAAFLGKSKVIGVERRRQLLKAAVSRRSGDVSLLMTLGLTYTHQDGADEELRWYQAATAAAPRNAAAHNNLGGILCDVKRDYDGAIACYKKAIELDPKLALAHNNLGNALDYKAQPDEAIACYKKAIELDPKDASPTPD